MTNSVERIQSYSFSPQDAVFLDANIWLYIFGPNSKQDWKVKLYSNVWHQLLIAKSQIFIDVIVLSEFINTYARMKWRTAMQSSATFKDYRQSQQFPKVARAISADARRLLSHCNRVESGFSTVNLPELLNDFATGTADFNDQVIAELCRINNLKLITHDADFRGRDIPILTANTRLLP